MTTEPTEAATMFDRQQLLFPDLTDGSDGAPPARGAAGRTGGRTAGAASAGSAGRSSDPTWWRDVLDAAFAISDDVGDEVGRLLAAGAARPLDDDEARALLTRVVDTIRRGAERRGDRATLSALTPNVEELVSSLLEAKRAGTATKAVSKENGKRAGAPPALRAGDDGVGGRAAPDGEHEGAPTPVTPSPVFHGRRVAMLQTRMRTRDLHLWTRNERLDIHLEQFETIEGRPPTEEEVLDIMQGLLRLPGVGEGADDDDEFEIVPLAENVAMNGVRRPPILDNDGATLLDGNRRVAACYYVLNSPTFTDEEKARAEYLWVWQLSDHADDADRQAVIVSLNFEDDHKLTWPDYVRARKVADAYATMRLRVGEANLTPKRDAEIKRDLAKRFAVKPARVGLYLQQVAWADKFEAYHAEENGRDLHEVRHLANRKFSYFKELSDGITKDDGVARVLTQDPDYRGLVFDLLFQNKFKNWESIRLLKHHDDQLERQLRAAAAEPDQKLGMRDVTVALNAAYERHVDKRRTLNADLSIQNFVKFLENLPPKAYLTPAADGGISLDSLRALVRLSDLAAEIARRAMEVRRDEFEASA